MNFREMIRFECALRYRQGATWIYLFLYLVLVLLLTGMLIDEAQQGNELLVNAPFFITFAMILASMAGMLFSAGLFSDAALRDRQTGIAPLFHTAPVSRSAMVWGRFTGTLGINLLLTVIVPLGLMATLSELLIAPEWLGPFRAGAFLQPWLVLLLPNLLITSAIFFALATLTRKTLPVYGGILVLFLGSLLCQEVLVEILNWQVAGILADPFGITWLIDVVGPWTPVEQNSRTVPFGGLLLWNRLLWLGLSGAMLSIARWRYRPGSVEAYGRRGAEDVKEVPGTGVLPVHRGESLDLPPALQRFDLPGRMVQIREIAGRYLSEMIRTRDFLLIAGGLILLMAGAGMDVLRDSYGTQVWPATRFLIEFMNGFMVDTVLVLLIIYYAGELVWRERDDGVQGLADATPVDNGTLFLGKFLALAGYILVLLVVLHASAVLLQTVLGYYRFEWDLYLKVQYGILYSGYLTFAVLALFIHILVNRKYVGHLVVLTLHLFPVAFGFTGLVKHLFQYGSVPGWEWSDMSGFGPMLEPVVWYRLYWVCCAVAVGVAAMLFQVRGRETGLRDRLRQAAGQITFVRAGIVAGSLLLMGAVGGYIWYQTVASPTPANDPYQIRAEYEKRYRQYAGTPQPLITGVSLQVEIYPRLREVEVRGTYRMENRTATPVDTVHLFLSPLVQTSDVTFNRPFRQELADTQRGHAIYALEQALAPGDSLQVEFQVRFLPDPFDPDPNLSVLENGTYIMHTSRWNGSSRSWLPLVGYQPNREWSDPELRTKLGLGPHRTAPPESEGGVAAGSPRIAFEAVIGTDIDQTAVAPGTLRETWTENWRRYFRYVSDGTIKNDFAILSAEYEVHRSQWEGIPVEIYHHPDHNRNIERMRSILHATLDRYTAAFGPYPHRQFRLVEYPSFSRASLAYPGMVAQSEAWGFLSRPAGDQLDSPAMVISRELAHQWWGGVLEPAERPGWPMLTEVLANYSAMAMLEQLHGKGHLKGFLLQMYHEYLNRRTTTEGSLAESEHDQNLVYRKGVLAMHALKEYVGAERIDRALNRLLERHTSGALPDPGASDLMEELRTVTPDSLQYLLTDLFEENTVWDLRTLAVQSEDASESGFHRVTLDLETYKLRGDSTVDYHIPMEDLIEIGVYGYPRDEPGGEEQLLYLDWHRIESGQQTVTLTVPGKPTRAGIDPRHLLIEPERGDNVKQALKIHR